MRHPAAYACTLLNSQPLGFYGPSAIVQDAQRHGVEVRPACAVASSWDSTLEPEGSTSEPAVGRLQPALRLGLRLIKGLGEAEARALVAARERAPFGDYDDLVDRARPSRAALEALAEAGALELLVPGRRAAPWQARAPRGRGLFRRRTIAEMLVACGRVERDGPVVHLIADSLEPLRGPGPSPRLRSRDFR
ncbi:MAG TPA: hypothetical protein VFS43_40675 [Polyangiaceae bacterium]|nr:hypothetical protein [Polyangiaceae bacterium]